MLQHPDHHHHHHPRPIRRWAFIDADATSIIDIRATPYDVDLIETETDGPAPPSDLDDPEGCVGPDATSIYDIRPLPNDVNPDDRHFDDVTAIYAIRPFQLERRAATLRRLICTARHDIAGLRSALASGWDIGPELAYEERRLATLVHTLGNVYEH